MMQPPRCFFFSTLIPNRKRIKINSKPLRLRPTVPLVVPLKLRVQYNQVLNTGNRTQSTSFSMSILETVHNVELSYENLQRRLQERTGPSRRSRKIPSQVRLRTGTDCISEALAQMRSIIASSKSTSVFDSKDIDTATPGFHCRIGVIIRLTGRSVLRVRIRRRLRSVVGAYYEKPLI